MVAVKVVDNPDNPKTWGAECTTLAGYGKVFKARWKSTMVAVKVVQHSHIPKSNSNSQGFGLDRNDPASAEARIAREMLLSTSISHPNVIATYKICTICVGSMLDSGFPGTNEVSLSDIRSLHWRNMVSGHSKVSREQQDVSVCCRHT